MDSTELAAVKLPLRRSGSRFAVDDVDEFLAQCVEALRAGEQGHRPALSVTDIVVKQFRGVPLVGAGYDADAVDDLLDAVAIPLRAYAPPPETSSDTSEATVRNARTTLRLLTVLGVVGLAVGIILVVMKALGLA